MIDIKQYENWQELVELGFDERNGISEEEAIAGTIIPEDLEEYIEVVNNAEDR